MTNQKMEAASTLERWAGVHDMEIFFNLKVGLGAEIVYGSKRFPQPPSPHSVLLHRTSIRYYVESKAYLL